MFNQLKNLLVLHARMVIFLVACSTGLIVAALHATAGQENILESARARILHRSASGQVVVVQIDNKSLDQFHAWPWPRSLHAKLVDKLHAAGAKRIIFNIDFTSPAPDVRQDWAFANALKRAGGSVVLPGTLQPLSAGSDPLVSFVPPPVLSKNSLLSNIYIRFETGLAVYENYGITLRGRYAPSIATYIADRSDIPNRGVFPIDWSIDPASFDRISYADVIDGYYDPSFFRGRIVLIGATADRLDDKFASPVYGLVPGVVVNAIAGETLRRGTPHPIGQAPMLLFALAVAAVACCCRNGAVRMAVLAAGIGATFVITLALRGASPIEIESVAGLAVLFAGILTQSVLWTVSLFSDPLAMQRIGTEQSQQFAR
jgi:CHASE2 domain-containing sensor protein